MKDGMNLRLDDKWCPRYDPNQLLPAAVADERHTLRLTDDDLDLLMRLLQKNDLLAQVRRQVNRRMRLRLAPVEE